MYVPLTEIFVDTCLPPLRLKILYALRLFERKFLTKVKVCRSEISGEGSVFVGTTGKRAGTAAGDTVLASSSKTTAATLFNLANKLVQTS